MTDSPLNVLDLMGALVPLVVISGIGLPILNDVASQVNSTGATVQALNYVPLAMVFAFFIAAVALVGNIGAPATRKERSSTTEPTETETEETEEETSSNSKPGIKILGYRVSW